MSNRRKKSDILLLFVSTDENMMSDTTWRLPIIPQGKIDAEFQTNFAIHKNFLAIEVVTAVSTEFRQNCSNLKVHYTMSRNFFLTFLAALLHFTAARPVVRRSVHSLQFLVTRVLQVNFWFFPFFQAFVQLMNSIACWPSMLLKLDCRLWLTSTGRWKSSSFWDRDAVSVALFCHVVMKTLIIMSFHKSCGCCQLRPML